MAWSSICLFATPRSQRRNLEAGVWQCFPADELARGSAFHEFRPENKTNQLLSMIEIDWENRFMDVGESVNFTHG